MTDAIDKGLNDCSEGVDYIDYERTPGLAARQAAYAVLRCCGLIRAGDNRVPERIARLTQEMSK